MLSHYDGVVWELGDNRLTQEEEDVDTEAFGNNFADLSVAEVEQFTTLAIRDYLIEGGKLFRSGEDTAYFGPNVGVSLSTASSMQRWR